MGKALEFVANPIGSVVGGLGGAILQSRSQGKALKAQEASRQEALAYERQQQANAQKRQRQQWDAYQTAYQNWYSRYGDKGIDRYGVPVGVKYGAAAAPAGAPGTPGATVGGIARAPVTLAGGRQVDPDEYNRYVTAREQRRGQTLGQLAQPMRPGVVT